MAGQKPKQSPGYEQNDISALAKQIKADLRKLKMAQKDLAVKSGLPEARGSRILRCGHVRLTELDINQLALALKKTPEERDKMRYLAWPELHYIDEALRRRDGSITEVNWQLAEEGLSLLGNVCEE